MPGGLGGLASGDIGGLLVAGDSLEEIVDSQRWFTTSAHLEMQGDGNLVLYARLYNEVDVPLWQSGTAGHAGAYAAVQTDGNVVVYAADGITALWQSGTAGRPGAVLLVQGDANVVVLDDTGAAGWQSGTALLRDHLEGEDVLLPGQDLQSQAESAVGTLAPVPGPARLVMQTDGNLVAYDEGRAYWQSGTAGHPGAYLAQQADENLVVYAPDGRTALWQAGLALPVNQDPWDITILWGWGTLSAYGDDTDGDDVTQRVVVRGPRPGPDVLSIGE
ncbi:hypothetical protein [Cellulomonas marina]|uniref:hypothetical protein n=1 Tax=Cellulomonas marina TaxID=988821 RepID=UPI0015871ADC|nr:hypothetical protein [Cellulomonas marina]GIG30834.1 hypothetical protein Cma02nite_34340 [Cellulomonas marina]